MLGFPEINAGIKVLHELSGTTRAKPEYFIGGFRLEDESIRATHENKPLMYPLRRRLRIIHGKSLLEERRGRLYIARGTHPHDLPAGGDRVINMFENMRSVHKVKRRGTIRQGAHITDGKHREVRDENILHSPFSAFFYIDLKQMSGPTKRIVPSADI